MKRLKKVLCLVLPLVLVAVVVLCVAIGRKEDSANADEIMPLAMTSTWDGQVITSDEDTGAATAARDYKGGAIFLEPYSTMTMWGGMITGHKNTYGGAVYVSSGASFYLQSGTLYANEAAYGGAIYVEAGGYCYVNGSIVQNSATGMGSAIYAEEGATIEMGVDAIIEGNITIYTLPISPHAEEVGEVGSGLWLHTATIGSYPQTFVGQSLRDELESWWESTNPEELKSFDMGNAPTWPEYNYKGELYVRVRELGYDDQSAYKDGTTLSRGGGAWFRVEPIKWYILNYADWLAGWQESMELFAAEILAGNTSFDMSGNGTWETSSIRAWCNGAFYNDAFTDLEKSVINLATIKNNTEDQSEIDGAGKDTQDHVFLKSYQELTTGVFTNQSDDPSSNPQLVAAASDFAVANTIVCRPYETVNGTLSGVYWLRSTGEGGCAYCCLFDGLIIGNPPGQAEVGARPAIQLNV